MKVCFVGVGSIGKRHIKNLSIVMKEKAMPLVVHVLRRRGNVLDDDVSKVINKEIYDIEKMDDMYDAIFITNPTYLHYETLLKLKNKTNYFFVEKPVFDDINIDASEFTSDNSKQYYVACPLRYTKVLRSVNEMLTDEKVISIRAISSSFLPEWRAGVDYRETYSAHKEQGGGVSIDLIHEWDYLSSLFGFPNDVIYVCGKYSHLDIDSEDLALYIGVYDDKLVELHLDYFGRNVKRQVEIYTNEAVYLFDIANSKVYRNGKCIREYEENANDKYLEEMRYFCKLQEGKCTNTNNIEHALKVMKIAVGKI